VPAFDALRAAAEADIRILPYQLEPVLAVVAGLTSRVLIADDVGSGKTIQAGLIVAETLARRGDARVLVLCPAGLRQQWQDELTSRFHLDPLVLDSASLRGAQPLAEANPWALHPLVLTSIDFIKRVEVVRALESLVWDLLVIDEAHGVAGPSDRHTVAALLSQRARVVVMLTATPHSGDPDAFARLTSAGSFNDAFPLLAFRRARADAEAAAARRTRWLRVRPTAIERQMHRALLTYAQLVWRRPSASAARLAMIILMRRACSSASSLARSVERRLALLANDVWDETQLALPLGPDADDEPDAFLGAHGLANPADERRMLEAILTLAREATFAESKLRALARFLRRAVEPAIVFTEYRDTLATLDRELSGFSTCALHGGLTAAERRAVLRKFSAGSTRILLATDAASEGLNLQQRCRLVVHLELPWTPTRVEQRVGRVDRIGQTRTVHQVHLIAAGSVEESHVATVTARASRVARVLNVLSRTEIDDQRTARYAIGGEPLPEVADSAELPRGVMTADLRSRATAEAARLLEVRQLMADTKRIHEAMTSNRPFATAVGRRAAGRCWCAVHLEFVDLDGQLIWETLAGAEAPSSREPLSSAAEVRRFVDQLWSRVRERIAEDHAALAAALTGSMRLNVEMGTRREAAIAGCIEDHHARLAAALLQPGLFDRRAERQAAAQRELLNLVLGRCRTRFEELRRRRDVMVAGVRPAFSLVTW
jgi:superfamily II DNA or RNA helicase